MKDKKTAKNKLDKMKQEYENMEDSNYKKKQLYVKIKEYTNKYFPKVIWNSNIGPCCEEVKKSYKEGLEKRLEEARQKDLEEQKVQESEVLDVG